MRNFRKQALSTFFSVYFLYSCNLVSEFVKGFIECVLFVAQSAEQGSQNFCTVKKIENGKTLFICLNACIEICNFIRTNSCGFQIIIRRILKLKLSENF
jgi:hypothetical protein